MHRIIALMLCCGIVVPVPASPELDLELASRERVLGEGSLRYSVRLHDDSPDPTVSCGVSGFDVVVRREAVRIVSVRDLSIGCGVAPLPPLDLPAGASLVMGGSFHPALDAGSYELIATYDCALDGGIHLESEPLSFEVLPPAGGDVLVLEERSRAIEAIGEARARHAPELVEWPAFDAALAEARPTSQVARELAAFRAVHCDGFDGAELAECLALVRHWIARAPEQAAGDLAWAEADLLCRLGRETELTEALARIQRAFPWHVPISGFVSVVPAGSSIAEQANRHRKGMLSGLIDGGIEKQQLCLRFRPASRK